MRKVSKEGVDTSMHETEHRDMRRTSQCGAREDFATRAEALRRRLRSSVDSSEIIRADRDRDIAGDSDKKGRNR